MTTAVSHKRKLIIENAITIDIVASRTSLRNVERKIQALQAPIWLRFSHGFSPESVNVADFPFDSNRIAIAPLPLQAKAVSNERHVRSISIPYILGYDR